jgi:methionine sulfoxide reductase heme-binding subunit
MTSGRELWYLSRGTGVVTLILLTATVVLGIVDQQRWSSRAWPRFVLDKLHRNLSLLVLCVLGLHVATVVTDSFVSIRLVDAVLPFGSGYRPLFVGLGALAFDMLVAVALTSGLRAHLGHRAWRIVHWLAYAAWPVALVHSFGAGTDARSGWMLAISGTCTALVLAAVWTRLGGLESAAEQPRATVSR